MTTVLNLIRWSGVCAMAAGILFVFVGLLHPANVPASVGTGVWTVVHLIAFAVSFFGPMEWPAMRVVSADAKMGLAAFR